MKLGEEATTAGALLDTRGSGAERGAGARVQLSGGHLSVMDGPVRRGQGVHQLRAVRGALQGGGRRVGLPVHEAARRSSWPGWEGDCEVLKVFGPEDFAPPG